MAQRISSAKFITMDIVYIYIVGPVRFQYSFQSSPYHSISYLTSLPRNFAASFPL